VVAEQIGDGSFLTGSNINATAAHAHWRNRQITGKMYADRRVIALLWHIEVAVANGRVRFLTGSS